MEWVALIAVIILWRVHASKTKELSRITTKLTEERFHLEEQIRSLTRRVFELEKQERVPTPPLPAKRIPEVVEELPPPVVTPIEPALEILPTPAIPEMIHPLESVPENVAAHISYVPPPSVPEPTLEDRMRERMASTDWEAMIGGSWLNAIGILILVVSVALFLGYALTQFGPLGKVSIGVGIGVVMILGGVMVERKERYATFGRGLIAGGWATLYFTSYAMHAFDAARVIESPFLAGALQLLVACGMIAHSLRYRNQTLTLLAYFSAYAAMQLAPMSTLSIAATIPLAISLLTISRYLEWTNAPIAGMVLTYFTFAFRYHPSEMKPVFGAATLYSYWLAFEIHDLLKLRSAAMRRVVEMTFFPLNALLLVGVAMMTLPKSTPIQSSYFLATAGTVFLISTILRMKWKAVYAPPANPMEDILAQSHRIGITFAASLFGGSILRRFDTVGSEVGLILEAQLLVLAGLRAGERYFTWVGAAVFGAAAFGMAARSDDFASVSLTSTWSVAGWIPMALVLAAFYYFNRWLTKSGAYYTWGALLLLLAGTGEATKNEWTGVIWIGLGLVLIEASWRSAWRELLYQGMAAAVVGFLGTYISGFEAGSDELKSYGTTGIVAAGLMYAIACRLFMKKQSTEITGFATLMGSILAANAMWQMLPAPLVALGWGALALALLETGIAARFRWAKWQAHVLALLALGRLFVANFPIFSETAGIPHRILTVVPLLVLAWHFWSRTKQDDGPQQWAHRIYPFAGALVAGALLRFELGSTLAVLGWSALLLAYLHFGLKWQERDFVWIAYALGVATFARGWATNFASNDVLLAMPSRILTGLFVIGAFHAAQFRLTRQHRYARPAFALMATALLSILLYYEVSGSVLTIAWGMQAVAILTAGFLAQERVMRFAGLGLLALCILKLFFYDLRNLETLSRILSFFVLGLVLMGASWLYMRFREKIQRYL